MNICSDTRLLVIAAHPDDELLGCGGAVAKVVANGGTAEAIIVCEGESHRGIDQSSEGVSHSQLAAGVLGFSKLHFLAFPDQQLDTLPLSKVIGTLERVVGAFKPNMVYVQYGGDVNADHKVVFEAALVATRPTNEFIKEVFSFSTLSSTEWAFPRTFVPDTWVDVAEYMDKKIAAMNCYETELRAYPHPRSIEGIVNRAKCSGNEICIDQAETFMTIRAIA